VKPLAALSTSALFAWQPMLWGHAFINPKDPPFLTFFLASICLGFEMVDKLNENGRIATVIFPAVILGITTSIRVLGPLAGILIFIYFIFVVQENKHLRVSVSPWLAFITYSAIAILTMFLTWPYLWESPTIRFFDVLRFMSDNPTNLSVLFGGEVYRAGELPRKYLPFILATTLTEPVWILFVIGVVTGYAKLIKQNKASSLLTPYPEGVFARSRSEEHSRGGINKETLLHRQVIDRNIISLTLVLLWFLLLIAYVLIRKPAMYDGIRHFLFIIPPIFILIGFAFESILDRMPSYWLRASLLILFLLPGIQAINHLHPYEYTYYNSFIGGTDHAFRSYETDYWLTCYKDAVEALDKVHDPINLYVHREAYIAGYYANKNIVVKELRGEANEVKSGDYVLVNTRTNEDRRILKDGSPIIQIQRGDALFCIIKRVP
jgi:hypothetical protein